MIWTFQEIDIPTQLQKLLLIKNKKYSLTSFILDLTPILIHQESTRQAIQILVDQPSHDNVVVHHSIEIISDYNHDIWKYQFLELFPYGLGDLNEQHPTKLGLEVYMANTLQLSSRWFVQHHAFPLITFNMLVHNHASTFVYVCCKVHLVDATQVAIVSQKNLVLQVRVIALWPTTNS